MRAPKIIEKLEKRLELLATWRYVKILDVPLEMMETEEHLRQPPVDASFVPAPLGSRFGRHWATVWFRTTITLPRECRGRRVYYRKRSFAEKLLFVNGALAGAMNPFQHEVLLQKSPKGGESLELYIETYCGHPIADPDPHRPEAFIHQFIMWDPGQDPPLLLESSELLMEREQVAGLFYDADTLFRTAKILPENSRRKALLIDGVNRALDKLPWEWETEDELESAAKAIRKELAPLLNAKNTPSTPQVGIVGHAHIDIGWLWPVRESIRKAARTFSSVLGLMDDYPDMRFVQSQPWLLDVVQQHYPELLPRIRKRVKEGAWEPNGGMWIEADCNVPSGESLVRQFLEGRKKLQELFGYKGDTLWLPDVFGYSAALPQILRLCEIDHFVTSKINWNDTNKFPYDTFWWEGIDGTAVFSHFINTTQAFWGYNSPVLPEAVQDPWDQVRDKAIQDSCISAVGFGDGGGGPSREMCEYASRMKDVEGCLKTEWVNTSQFLKRLREQDVAWPRWCGELYLELHRGTYTTQARTKRYNRKLEFLLREVEFYAALAMNHGAPYPTEALETHWRTLLTNQFHDILPGSSIREVYTVAEAEYAAMTTALEALRDQALAAIGATFIRDPDNEAHIVGNALSWRRTTLVPLANDGFNSACDASGAPLVAQRHEGALYIKTELPSMSATAIALRKAKEDAVSPFHYSGKTLESPFYSVQFDKAGKIIALKDKAADRDLVRPGQRLNDLMSFEDFPVNWDAWDIDRFYRDKKQHEDRLLSRELVADGPLFIILRSHYSIGRRSVLTQDMVFYAHTPRIEFRTRVEWHERHTLLKAAFPLAIHAHQWRNEIQFGHVTRNTHANTPWDVARFEVCAHKWVDVSEADYGVALLNDSKYGHDCLDDAISITLLKSSTGPDAEADQGVHEFTYALYPHQGPFSAAVVQEAYDLNLPPTAYRLGETAGNAAFMEWCNLSEPNIIIEAVKKAEADDAYIVRLYECEHRSTKVKLSFSPVLKKVTACNLMEERDQAVDYRKHTVLLEFRPFEIKTLKIYFK